MSLLIIILAVTATTLLAWAGAYLYDFIASDGYRRLRAHPRPLRSHPPDMFDPHRYG
jgi:hypothetical protein